MTHSSCNGVVEFPSRYASTREDVWTIVHKAVLASPIQPVMNLGQGFYGYNPPDFVIGAACKAIVRCDCNQYSPTKGRPRLLKAISERFSDSLGYRLDPDRNILITTGANEGMLCCFMAMLNPGDEVIVFEPFFDQYIPNIEMAGGKAVYVPLRPPEKHLGTTSSAADWKICQKTLERAITKKTRMIVVNTPHNPLGKVFTREELEAIGKLCVQNDILVLADEVYDSLSYTSFTHIAALSPELAERTIIAGSVGKTFYCTGWRVGFIIGYERLLRHVQTAHARICLSGVSPLQEAAAVAFEQADANDFWARSKTTVKAKLDLFNEIWTELGLPYSEPEGGFYVMANFARVQIPASYNFPPHIACRPRDFQLCWFLINEIGVAAIPPSEFCRDETATTLEDWLRFAICKEDDVLEEAKRRLRSLKTYITQTKLTNGSATQSNLYS